MSKRVQTRQAERSPAGRLIKRAAVPVLGLLFLSGCATDTGVQMRVPGAKPVRVTQGSAYLPSGAQQFVVSPFDKLQVDVYPMNPPGAATRIDAGNELDIVLTAKVTRYRIAPGDQLALDFNSDAVKATTLVVRADGKVTLPVLGRDLRVAGLTPDQVRGVLEAAYKPALQNYVLTVTVAKSVLDRLVGMSTHFRVGHEGDIVIPLLGPIKVIGLTPAAAARAIQAHAQRYFGNPIQVAVSLAQVTSGAPDLRLAPSGLRYFSHTMDVTPNGTIFVPHAGTVRAAGKTLSELDARLTEAVQRNYQNPISVQVSLVRSNAMSVFIGGEVLHPGRYAYGGPMTLLKLITTAGWVSDGGDLSDVILLHHSRKHHYEVFSANLEEVIAGQAGSFQDLRVSPGDIVIVPMTGAARADLFVKQYIRGVLPFDTSVNYTYIRGHTTSTVVQ
ncbi:MAG: polysaccharide biosynthesis/export family protein [Betaproteobacteria bacterium]|nr:polysaccharide biosynthesis/export family protein [Betaproteobacteria bacterium]